MFWRRTHAHDGGKNCCPVELPFNTRDDGSWGTRLSQLSTASLWMEGMGVGERGLTGTTKCSEYKISADAESVHTLIGVGDDDDLISIVVHTYKATLVLWIHWFGCFSIGTGNVCANL